MIFPGAHRWQSLPSEPDVHVPSFKTGFPIVMFMMVMIVVMLMIILVMKITVGSDHIGDNHDDYDILCGDGFHNII